MSYFEDDDNNKFGGGSDEDESITSSDSEDENLEEDDIEQEVGVDDDEVIDDDIEDDDSYCYDDNEEHCEAAAIHPCNASEYAAAIHPCDIAFCQDDDNHDLCDDSFTDDITNCTPAYSMEMSTDNAANFRAEIENHFVNERAKVTAPPLVRTNSVHCYDEAVDVDVDDNDNDDDAFPTANDEYPFVSIAYADDGRIYVEYE
jgi:hypothetical protein